MKVFCLHETGTGPEVWAGLEEALGDRGEVVAHRRLGWRDDTPDDYRATTVDEQAEDAVHALEALGEPAVLCGAGLGAVIALDLLIGRPHLVSAAVLIEPPLLAFSAVATEQLAADRVELGNAVQGGGIDAGVELCLSGALSALAPGAERLPEEATFPARERPASLFAELGAVPAWSIPFTKLGSNERAAAVVVSAGTPALVGEAGDALAGRLGEARLERLAGSGPAHLSEPGAVAGLVAALSGGESSP